MLVGRKKLLLSDTTASLLPVGLAQEATDHPPDVVCDEDIEEAFRVLEEHHDRIIADGDDDVQILDFAVAVQGGAWSFKKHGRACDSFKGRVRLGSDAAEWCHKYVGVRSAQYDAQPGGEESRERCSQKEF